MKITLPHFFFFITIIQWNIKFSQIDAQESWNFRAIIPKIVLLLNE